MHVCVCPYTHIVIAAFYNKTHGNFKQKKNKNLKLVQTGNQHCPLPTIPALIITVTKKPRKNVAV